MIHDNEAMAASASVFATPIGHTLSYYAHAQLRALGYRGKP